MNIFYASSKRRGRYQIPHIGQRQRCFSSFPCIVIMVSRIAGSGIFGAFMLQLSNTKTIYSVRTYLLCREYLRQVPPWAPVVASAIDIFCATIDQLRTTGTSLVACFLVSNMMVIASTSSCELINIPFPILLSFVP